MLLWLFRRIRGLIFAILALAGMVSLVEVGLRIARLQGAVPLTPTASTLPKWQQPATTTGWVVPPLEHFTADFGETGREWTTNSWGQRGPEPVLPKPAGVYRVLCLGDEALLGPALAEEALFGPRLQHVLQQRTSSPVEVLTSAIPAGCPLTLMLAYRHSLANLQPDLVLVHVSSSQIQNDRQMRRWTVRDQRGVPLACVHPDKRGSRTTNSLSEYRQEFAIVDWLCGELSRRANDGPGLPLPSTTLDPPSPEEFEFLLGPFLSLKDLCYADRCRLVIWLCPNVRTESVPTEHRLLATQAIPWFSEQGLPAVDALEAVHPDMVELSVGWTAQGHASLAHFVGGELLANLPGPWSSVSNSPAVIPIDHREAVPQSVPEIRRPSR